MIFSKNPIDYILHLDKYLNEIMINFGTWTYAFLFIILFLETGIVITPFLPGDSLLFIAGAFAALGSLNIWILFISLSIAVILGDTINYWIGNYFGQRAFTGNRLFKKEYLIRTQEFYDKHGGKTIILARFIPIIRTFAPFIAGIGKMEYKKFFTYNVIGGIAWVFLFLFGGYWFGSIPIVKNNLTWVIAIIIVLSLVPVVYEYIKHKNKKHI